jgi:transcriptional regulator with XRE-family HTH domain
MIAPEVVQQIRRLLAEGKLSQRAIAGIVKVSRGTVGAIAAGKRPDYETLRRARKQEELPQPAGPPRRCLGCGGKVYVPCHACHVRKLTDNARRARALQPLARRDEPLELNLTEEHRARYEEVRLRRIARAESPADPAEPWDASDFENDEEYDLDPADVCDAFELDEAEPETDDAAVDMAVPDCDEQWLPDSLRW